MTTVAIMRPLDRIEESRAQAKEMGFEAICASPIEIEVRPSPEYDGFLESLRRGGVDIVFFTSATGVQAAFELAERHGMRAFLLDSLRGLMVGVIGPATARRLEREGVTPQLLPQEFTSRGIAAAAKDWGIEGKRVVVLRSDRGSAELHRGLTDAGSTTDEIIVYKLLRRGQAPDVVALIEAGERGDIDAFLFTSSLSSRALLEEWGRRSNKEAAVRAICSRKVAAIGPPTKATLESMGVRVDVMPLHATFRDLLIAVRESMQ